MIILSKLKAGALFLLGMVSALLYAVLQKTKAKQAQEERDRAEQSREVEQLGVEAMVGGLENEKVKRHEEIDTSNRDYFSR